ncbi:MAG: choice-of-anchor J domain-containing protein [Candidatus Cloacimonetes bacterium]|nr:choice-of-anchor J domain-containing protein [Candidatus Cloacimonadota bacterium]
MKTQVLKLLLLLFFLVNALSVFAVVSEYSFTSILGTFTEISGGTIHGTSANDNECFIAIPLGFTFTYNDVDYTTISIASNGFIAMGDTVATSTVPISSATSTNNVIAVLSRDIKSRAEGTLMSLSSGTAPNRVFTIQWKNWRRSPTATANDDFTFQIQLQENGNKVVFVYGPFTAVTASTANTVQVGLRGDSNADFNNRTTTTDWSATIAGTANNNSCTLSASVFPANGLTFTFTPPVTGEPPLAAQNPHPANGAINVPIGTNLTWITGGGIVDGYKVYFGTDNPPTNIVSGVIQTATVYDPANDLNYSTTYYWKIVPFNQFGDAVDCPVWSFTVLADPTVTTYPYEQNFDLVTVPDLPPGWTVINANNDTYTWQSYNANSQTPPNSMRIRYNAAIAMDDWLISPPLVFTDTHNYKIKFYYCGGGSNYEEKLSVYWGTTPTAAGLTNLLWQNLNITNTTYETAEIILPSVSGGTYYIGFHGHSDADKFYIYLDTFSVMDIVEQLDPPQNLTATVQDNYNVHLDWDAPGAVPPPPTNFTDGFETYTDFSLEFTPWTLVDVDQSSTYGISGFSWLNIYAAQAYIIFNPTTTTPAVTTLTAHTGNKMAACFAATTPPNNDWMITPQLSITSGNVLKFWARSYTAQYGLERFKVGVSTSGTAPANFNIISGTNYIQAPVEWTEYTYDLSSYVGLSIYIGIQCVSSDAFIFLVDDVFIGNPTDAKVYPYVASVPGTIERVVGIPAPTIKQEIKHIDRDLLGYKVYRDGNLIDTINNVSTTDYTDLALAVGTYSYTVTAFYTTGESVPAGPVSVTIVAPLLPPTNLTATVDGNDVTLNWGNPEPPPPGQWITWCNDVLGNSIGTNSAANFDVAHRWPVADLAPYVGDAITQVKFVPAEANCVYTVKIWTGGSANNAGTLVYSHQIQNPVIDSWNVHALTTPVTIPANSEVWIGYNCNTMVGFPAGCDIGPQIDGKGNMMYFQGVWSTLLAIEPALTYNWLISTYVSQGATLKKMEMKPIADLHPPVKNSGELGLLHKEIANLQDRVVTGYKVYRNGALLTTISDPTNTTYSDLDLANGTYTYGVSALYPSGESVPATVEAIVNIQLAPAFFTDDFESYPDFATMFAPWTSLDVDLSSTYVITGIEFPGSGSPMAFIVFNPSSTVPPATTIIPHSGTKMVASIAATTPPNNDWLITPRVYLGTNAALKFYAKSHTAQYGMERFRIGISTQSHINPQGFQYITGNDYVEVPTNWTEYIYDLSVYDNQNVYIGIRCVSNDAFIFFADDISIHGEGGHIVSNDDELAPVVRTELKGNYPNPFNPETTIAYSVKETLPVTIEIYNLKGQKVTTLVNETLVPGNYSIVWKGLDDNNHPVASGVYFFKMNAGKYSSTKKMIMMK